MSTDHLTCCDRSFSGTHSRRFYFPALMILFCVSASMAFAADAMSQSSDFDIAPQAVESALHEWSRQANVQVMVGSDEVFGQRTDGVKGRLTAAVALARLLQQTDLTYETVGDKTVTVRRVAAATTTGSNKDAPEQSSQAEEGASTNPGSDARGGRALEEVIVSAQKREERLQDVPISISVLGGEELERSTLRGITDALRAVPGVSTTIFQQGGESLVTVRGVTAALPQANGSSPVAYYIDSMPFGQVKTAVGPDMNAYDLQRVEVLRGPQGTLYGASALNGVVRVLTNSANPDEFELKARASLSSTEGGGENYRGDMAVNVPVIAGKLGARAVVGYESLSGWVDRPLLGKTNANDSTSHSFRFKARALPTDKLSVDASAWLSRSDQDELPVSRDGKISRSRIDEPASSDYDVYGLNIGYEFSGASLSFASSYLDYRNESVLNVASTPLFTHLGSEVTNQELLLSSIHDGKWRWSLGGMYRDAEDRLLVTLPALLAPIDFGDLSKSYAIFGELTRVFLDGQLELTGGVRYFEDEVAQVEHVSYEAQPDPLYQAERTFTATSPRIVLNWHPSETLVVYGSYSEGFRSGFNQDAEITSIAPDFPPVKADTLSNYELGAKGRSSDGRLTYDAAVYYIDWRNVQQSLAVPVNNTFVTAPINGDSASGIGADLAVAGRPIDALELSASVSWNDLSMDNDVFSEGVLLFDQGDRLNYSPEVTGAVSAAYSFPLGRSGYEGQLSTSATYTSDQSIRTIVGGTQTIWQGDSLLYVNAGVSLRSPGGWTARVFANNVNNEEGVFILGIFSNPDRTVRVRPRTVGLQLEYAF